MKQKLFSVSKNDFDIEFFRGSGPGGQNRNKVSTCVRLTHRESGVVTLGVEERMQHQNKMIAFNKMIKNPTFKAWLKLKTARMLHTVPTEKEIEAAVDEMMKPENLKIELGVLT
jgi:protein subunit release factor B